MKKILLIIENLGSGGAERQLTGLAILLKNRGYDVKVVTYYKKQFYESYLRENNIDYELYEKAMNKYTRVFYLLVLFRRIKPDIIISFLPSTNMAVCLTGLFYRKSKIIVSERSHTLNFGLKVKLLFNLYRVADFVVPNSFSEMDNIISHFPFLKKKMVSIPNFIDTEKFCPLVPEKKHDNLTIITVARLIPSKNMLIYIDAISELIKKNYNIKVIWVGSQSDKNYLFKVKEKITKMGLDNVIQLKDQTNDIVKEYQRADIFCLPTLFEGYPNVVCEAMSCGLPVVCSNVFEIPKIVEEGKNGFLFNPNDYIDISNSLRKAIDLGNEEFIEMSRTNRIKIISNNNSDSIVDKYINLF